MDYKNFTSINYAEVSTVTLCKMLRSEFNMTLGDSMKVAHLLRAVALSNFNEGTATRTHDAIRAKLLAKGDIKC